MKIVFHAPDSALPQDFTRERADAFRAWALHRLQSILFGSEIVVTDEALIDPACMLVVVEGGTPTFVGTVNTFCMGLLPRFLNTNKVRRKAMPGQQVWIGGFCQWVPL